MKCPQFGFDAFGLVSDPTIRVMLYMFVAAIPHRSPFEAFVAQARMCGRSILVHTISVDGSGQHQGA